MKNEDNENVSPKKAHFTYPRNIPNFKIMELNTGMGYFYGCQLRPFIHDAGENPKIQ